LKKRRWFVQDKNEPKCSIRYMKIDKKINKHYESQKFARITRLVAEDSTEISRGYIVDYSKDFIVLQESDDFRLLGFNILPIQQFKEIRYNASDKYYDKIMAWENVKEKIGLKTTINLIDWKSIFKTFKRKSMNVIVECEDPEIGSFTIGSIEKITNKSVSILYFNAEGVYDKKPTKIKFEYITKVMFDDRYLDVFSKYTIKENKK